MRRPRIGNKIADSLLTASHRLEMEAEWERKEGWDSVAVELELAAEYTLQLAMWYREKKGVE